eukprot:2397091-Prymnesium_polylepis.2
MLRPWVRKYPGGGGGRSRSRKRVAFRAGFSTCTSKALGSSPTSASSHTSRNVALTQSSMLGSGPKPR